MFNRTIKFEVVKPPKNPQEIEIELTHDQKLQRALEWKKFGKELVKDISKLAAAYMLLDTFRKSTVAKAAAQGCCNCIKS